MLNLEDYKILAREYAKGSYANELELGLWLTRWYARSYGVPIKEVMQFTLFDLLMEYLGHVYLEEPETFAQEEALRLKAKQEQADEEWSKKIMEQEDLDPRVKEMMGKLGKSKLDEETMNKFKEYKPVSFGE